jgi:hypothetical protein
VFPGRKHDFCKFEFFEQAPNRLAELLPQAAEWAPVLRVIDLPFGAPDARGLRLQASNVEQEFICYVTREWAVR